MVIGAPKCGSTSLFSYLEAHPQVHKPARKELCFFSEFKRHLQRYRTGLPTTSWQLYQAAFAGVGPLQLQTAVAFGGAVGGRRGWRGRGRGRGRGRRGRGRGRGRWLAEAETASAERAAQQASLSRSLEAAGSECREQRAFEGCPFYLGEARAAGLVHRAFPQLRCVAVLRNPRERTVSAFNDYVRMGRISSGDATRVGLEELVEQKVALVASGNRTMEDFDVRPSRPDLAYSPLAISAKLPRYLPAISQVRILTSGVYIHGLKRWGEVWPRTCPCPSPAPRLHLACPSPAPRLSRCGPLPSCWCCGRRICSSTRWA